MITIRLGQRGTITIPKEIRELYHLEEGDRLTLEAGDGEVILRPIPFNLLDLRGSVPVPDEQDFAAIREQVLKEQAERAARDEG